MSEEKLPKALEDFLNSDGFPEEFNFLIQEFEDYDFKSLTESIPK